MASPRIAARWKGRSQTQSALAKCVCATASSASAISTAWLEVSVVIRIKRAGPLAAVASSWIARTSSSCQPATSSALGRSAAAGIGTPKWSINSPPGGEHQITPACAGHRDRSLKQSEEADRQTIRKRHVRRRCVVQVEQGFLREGPC